jgi:hypothetical protein
MTPLGGKVDTPGGPRIKRYLAEHPLLKVAADMEMDTHPLAVFEKV